MSFLEFNMGRVADWSSDGYIRSEFEEVLKNKNQIKAEELSKYIKIKKYPLDPDILITDILDVDGVIVVSTIPGRVSMKEPRETLNKEYNFDKAKNAPFGQTFFSGIVEENEPGHSKHLPMWHVSTPIVSLKSGEVIGVMVNHILNNKFNNILIKNEKAAQSNESMATPTFLVKGNTIEIYLVNSDELMVTPSRFVKNAVLVQKVDTEPVKKCINEGKSTNGIYNDYRGISVYGAGVCVDEGRNWTLVAEINESEVSASLQGIQLNILLLSIFASVFSVIFIYFLSSSITYRVKKISESFKKMTQGKLGQKIEIKTTGDEIGDLIESFNVMSLKLEEVDKEKSEFVSLASHQLLTPLTTIRWLAEVISSGNINALSERQKECLEDIDKIDKNMIELVRALLDVSRIELGTFSIEPEIINVADIVNDVLSEIESMLDRKAIKVAKDFGQAAPIISADPKLLRIVFQNLLTNAAKYTPENGKIAIELKWEDNKLIIKISDTGYGIPKELQSKVFSKFFRGDNIKAKAPEGTGLGLYIVKSIIDHSGGKIWFESEKNKGTSFYISYSGEGMIKKEGTKQLGA